MKKELKGISAAILTVVMALSTTFTSFSENKDESMSDIKKEVFNGCITGSDRIDIGNIKIDIYKSTLVLKEDDYSEYENSYAFSVYTSDDGEFSFNRPSENFLIEIDLSTLPNNTGVTVETEFINEGVDTFSTYCDYINSAEIVVNDLINSEIEVYSYNSDNEQIFSNYTVNKNHSIKNASKYTINTVESLSSVNVNLTANINGFVKNVNYFYELPKSTVLKIYELEKIGIISEEQEVSIYAEYIKKSGELDENTSEFISQNVKETTVKASARTNEILTALNNTRSVDIPNYNDMKTYAGAYFNLYYENGDYTTSTLQEINATLNSARAFFVSSCEFPAPIKRSTDTKYSVYLIKSTGSTSTSTTHQVSGGLGQSYIVATIPSNYTMNNEGFSSTLAHELFHAISYNYFPDENDRPARWFREATATWAEMMYKNKSVTNVSNKVNDFMATTEMSFHTALDDGHAYEERIYGAAVLFLTISEKFEISAVKDIFEELSELPTQNGNEYTAIDNTLKKSSYSYSLNKIFVDCLANSVYGGYYYEIEGSDNWDEPNKRGPYSSNVTINNIKPAAMASRYYEFLPKSGKPYLVITISDSAGNYNKDWGYSRSRDYVSASKNDVTTKIYADEITKSRTIKFDNFTSQTYNRYNIGLFNCNSTSAQTLKVVATYDVSPET